MYQPPENPWRVPFDGSFRMKDAETGPPSDYDREGCEVRLEALKRELFDLQRRLFARDRHALLLVFQAMDAAGKDSTIRAVMSGVDPAGCQVFSFKQPSREELDHDFLWRTSTCLPERGRIGVFNRSHYEEVLVVRVHPELLTAQNLPNGEQERVWAQRYRSIREHERHLARNGTIIVKFFLNVSWEKQRKRFVKRIDDPQKHWKFSQFDCDERQYWPDYMNAYQEALNATSRSYAPWYAIPADKKPYMHMQVCEIVVQTLRGLDLKLPDPTPEMVEEWPKVRERLMAETPPEK